MQTIIGAFDDTASAQRAVERLVQSGFDRDDVHVEQQQGSQMQQGGLQNETRQQGGNWDGQEREIGTDRRGFFAKLFGMDDDDNAQQNQYASHAYTYDEAVRRGSAVVVVDAQDETQADRASALLHECGAIDVDERSQQWRAAGWQPPITSGTQQTLAGDRTRNDLADNQQGTLDVVEEQLQVGKREVDRGGVRVVQRVSQKPVRELVRLREEHVVVDRHPVDRPATGADLSNFKEGTLEVHERSEEAVVAKTARVVEEVRVGKEVRDREETIEDTVRRKDVDVERLSANDRNERAVAADKKTVTNKDKPRL
jgi:uncharacterized protein (TIGR02271 family)